jgi:preprotein translocase subunit SecG
LTNATAWLAVLFFATSFGLALLANQKAVVEDDLGLVIPPAATATAVPAEEELPVLDDTPEAVTAPAGDDLPQLD